jgi:hypothetical protein
VNYSPAHLANLCGLPLTELAEVMDSLGIRTLNGRIDEVEASRIVSKLVVRHASDPLAVQRLRSVMTKITASRATFPD